MRQALATLSAHEGLASERALVRGETSPLRAATGLVFGGMLAGAFWTMAGLIVWCLA